MLIVDEAHHLSVEALEEVRLLTNLETAEHKLLQIVLVGQPELDDKLDSAKLTQLKQRIAIRSHLEPLDHEDTRGYIESRLRLVAAQTRRLKYLFPAKTIAAVYRHSRGIPRLINTICENALLSCYAKQMPSVTPEIIDEVARDFRLNMVRPAEAEKVGGLDEIDLQRAAKMLLELYGSMQKPTDPRYRCLAPGNPSSTSMSHIFDALQKSVSEDSRHRASFGIAGHPVAGSDRAQDCAVARERLRF